MGPGSAKPTEAKGESFGIAWANEREGYY